MKHLVVIVSALYLPIAVCGIFPPPADINPFLALAFIFWLAAVGAFAAYGIWRGSFG